jgi:hypothetical protein
VSRLFFEVEVWTQIRFDHNGWEIAKRRRLADPYPRRRPVYGAQLDGQMPNHALRARVQRSYPDRLTITFVNRARSKAIANVRSVKPVRCAINTLPRSMNGL